MLPKERRLVSDYDFRKVRQKGRKIRSSLFDLYYLPTKRKNPSRFGFVVSTRLDKRAVRRNRVKRTFREQIRAILPQVKEGFDLVFWVRKKALETTPGQLREAFKETLKRGGLVTDS